MTLKSLLIAATLAGGLALGASAANAQIGLYSVSGGGAAVDGSFDFNPFPTIDNNDTNYFFTAFDGSGAYSGITGFSISSLGFAGTENALFYDSANTFYALTPGTYADGGKAIVGDVLPLPVAGAAAVDAGATYTVTAVSAAPEPGMWVLMMAGVAMVGAFLRFGRKQDVLSVA